MSNDIKAGIKACLYKNPNKKGEIFLLKPKSIIYLIAGKTHEFYLADDIDVLGEDTKNRVETINRAKWAFLLSYYWNEAQKTKEGEILPLWADLGGGQDTVQELGIGKQYKQGSLIEITPSSENVWIGYFYRMEIFSYTPGTGMNLDFMILDKPKIRLGYFDKQFLKPQLSDFSINDGYYSYGEVIQLYLNTHLLPMKIDEFYHKRYGTIESEESFKNLKLEIKLTDEDGKVLLEEPVMYEDLQNYLSSEYGTTSNQINVTAANLSFKVPIYIDPKWKDNIHLKKDKTKNYSVFITIENTETGIKYTYTPDLTNLMKVSKSHRDFENKEIDSKFSVKYESMDTILANQEIKKNNMIQYVGDIEYNKKENNPCAYSVITVNYGEKHIEIFNEYKLSKNIDDVTNRFIDIVAGDNETKEIKIIVKFKKDKDAEPEAVRTSKNGHLCEKILNDGQSHNGIYDVFKMGWIVGQWVPSKDPAVFAERYMKMIGLGNKPNFYHPSNGSSSPRLEWDKSDQEAKGIESPNKVNYETVTVAGIQGLTSENYTIDEGTDSITLKLQYKYNKQYDNKILNYLYGEQSYLKGGIFSDNYKNIWVVRYLLKWMKNEPLEQLYFVPITTCRYPNQIAKIRVFPDMEWVLNFNYNIETPLYYKSTTALETYYSGFNEGPDITTANSSRRRGIADSNTTNILQPYVGRKTSFGLSVECEVSGEDDVIKLGKDFAEKYRQMLSPFLWMVSELDTRFAVSEARNEEANIRRSGSSGLLARLNKLPMSFELKPPSLGVGLGIKYATSKNGIITYELDGRLKADPIIGAEVKLDILALGSKLKPWGLIIDALDLASWATNVFSGGRVELDYKIEVRFIAEVKLVGKQTGVSSKGEKEYASEASLKYNLADKKLDFEGSLQGKILGEIEISASVKIKANVKDVQGRILDEKEDVAEAGIGAKASSYVKLTCPFKLNDKGNIDVDFFFSGVKLEIWFRAGLSSKNSKSSKPDFTKDLLPKIDLTKTIEF